MTTGGNLTTTLTLEEERQHLERLLAQHKRNLYRLEEVKAQKGLDTSIAVLNELDYERGELARVQAMIRRSSDVAEPTTLTVGKISMNLITREVVRAGKKIELQPLEFSLLEYLMRNAGRVVSKTMIMEHVWDYYFDPQTNVVESRIYKLREKIDKGFSSKMIHTVRGVGYVLKAENS